MQLNFRLHGQPKEVVQASDPAQMAMPDEVNLITV